MIIDVMKCKEPEWNSKCGAWMWRNNEGQIHRDNGPAVEYIHGCKFWYFNDKFHRTDGPAIEFADGEKQWYIEGKELTEAEFNKRK